MDIEIEISPEFGPAVIEGFQMVAAAMFLELARERRDRGKQWVAEMQERLRYQAATLEPPDDADDEVRARWASVAIAQSTTYSTIWTSRRNRRVFPEFDRTARREMAGVVTRPPAQPRQQQPVRAIRRLRGNTPACAGCNHARPMICGNAATSAHLSCGLVAAANFSREIGDGLPSRDQIGD